MICPECHQLYNAAMEGAACPHPAVVAKEISDRELDALVAEASELPIHYYSAEGWHSHQGDHGWLGDAANYPHLTAEPDRSRFLYWATPRDNGVEWKPSTDIASAMLVVEKMRERGWQVEIVSGYKTGSLIADNIGIWWVRFINNDDDMDNWSAENESLPRAICEAALATVKEATG